MKLQPRSMAAAINERDEYRFGESALRCSWCGRELPFKEVGGPGRNVLGGQRWWIGLGCIREALAR